MPSQSRRHRHCVVQAAAKEESIEQEAASVETELAAAAPAPVA